jgi:hypothetical protein
MSNDIAKNDMSYIEGWATFAEQSGLVPQGTNKYQAMAIVQAGKEMGLQPLQSLRTMNFIKGRLVMSVQLQLALAKNTKNVIVEAMDEGEGYCKVTLRRNEESITCEYTTDDAKKAGLIKPDGNWNKYGRQMLRWRAIGDALRIICPDLVMGLLAPEEAESIEPFVPSFKDAKPKVSKPEISHEINADVKEIVTGISEITQKAGKNQKGQEYTRFKIVGESDEFFTFDKKVAELIKTGKEAGLKICIKYSEGEFGKKIEDANLVEPTGDELNA